MRQVWVLTIALAWCAPAVAQSLAAPAPSPVAASSPSVQPSAPQPGSGDVPTPAVAAAAQGASTQGATPSSARLLAAGRVVEIELTDAVSSATAKRGDKFGLKLAEPIVLADQVVVPAGAPGQGEVVFSQHAGLMGEAGKLVLAARYVDFGGQRLMLHAFRLGAGGKDRTVLTFVATTAVGIVALMIPGGDVEFPAGMRANAKLASDVVLADAPAPAVGPPQPPTQTSSLP